nr:2-succinyl-5-enolpyruvyl-6-hydroxy-3-cyclohexene-1-carboxylic-acid synthase [Opitutaceae bacterium]
GGIFGHLPVAAFNPPFEEYWATPQTVDLAALCAAYQVKHYRADAPSALVARLAELVGRPGLHVVEVRTDRARDAATRKTLFASAARAAGDTFAK